MADVKDLLIRMSLDTNTFKQNVASAKAELRTLQAEFKATEAGGDVGKASGNLLRNLQEQKTVAEAMVKEYERGLSEIRNKLSTVTGTQAANQLHTDAAKLETALANAKTNLSNLQTQIDQFKMDQMVEKAQQAADVFMSLRLGFGDILDFFGDTADSADAVFVSREAALTQATKNVEDIHQTQEDLDALNDSLRVMSTRIPQTYEQLAALMGVGATLGVPYEHLLEFTEIMAKLNVATNVDGSAGAQAMAQFLNLTEKGYDNLDRVGAALTELGNNSATTEQAILEMAHRASTGLSTVGMSTADILALSAAINSVGIEAQAGGSAVSKLGITMDKAANVGAQNIQMLMDAWNTGDSGDVRSIYELYALLDTLPSIDGWKQFAENLGLTMADTKALMNSALAAERFSQAMGQTVDEFSANWNADAANQMLNFFQALGNMSDPESEENMLWTMDQLDIREIRQSNMVRALANNWELYAHMLALGRDAYEENIALENEAERAFGTNESRRVMNQNKHQNMLEAMGKTVTEMRKPFENFFADLESWFTQWPEWAQTGVSGAAEVLGQAGNVLNTAGQLAFNVLNITRAVQMLSSTGAGARLLSGAATAGKFALGAAAVGAAGYGLSELGKYLAEISDDTDNISTKLAGLEINIDPLSKQATLDAIREVKEAADGLSGDGMEKYQNTSRVVQMGYGTQSMYSQALAYEQWAAQQELETIYQQYGAIINSFEADLAAAQDEATRQMYQGAIESTEAQMQEKIAAAQARYGQTLNRVMGGAIERTGNTQLLEGIAEKYRALDMVYAAYNEYKASDQYIVPARFQDLRGVMEGLGFDMGDMLRSSRNYVGDTQYKQMANYIYTTLAADVEQAVQDGDLMSILMGAFSADAFEGADQGQLSGAVLGLLEAMDIKSIADQGVKDWTDIGKNSVIGLGNGITENAATAANAAASAANDVTAAAAAALGVHSPSTVFEAIGEDIDLGLAQGIYARADEAIAAANWLASQIEATMRSALQIHSPSGIARAMGGYFSQGLAEGLQGGVSRLTQAADRLGRSMNHASAPATVRIPIILDGRTVAETIAPLMDEALGEINWAN